MFPQWQKAGPALCPLPFILLKFTCSNNCKRQGLHPIPWHLPCQKLTVPTIAKYIANTPLPAIFPAKNYLFLQWQKTGLAPHSLAFLLSEINSHNGKWQGLHSAPCNLSYQNLPVPTMAKGSASTPLPAISPAKNIAAVRILRPPDLDLKRCQINKDPRTYKSKL